MKKLIFGNGEILVTPLMKLDSKIGRVYFQEGKGAHHVGVYSSAEDFEESDNDLIFEFLNQESLDVVMNRLNKLKNMMNGDFSGCVVHDKQPIKEDK